jgi:hypothetical protein
MRLSIAVIEQPACTVNPNGAADANRGRGQHDDTSQNRSFRPRWPFIPTRITPVDFNLAHRLDYRRSQLKTRIGRSGHSWIDSESKLRFS